MAERVGFEPTERFPAHSISSAANSTTLAPLPRISDCEFRMSDLKTQSRKPATKSEIRNSQSEIQLAERVGFEPTVEFPPLRFSRPVH